MARLVGLSLSFCVRDIIEGIRNLKDVKYITTSTQVVTHEEWEALLSRYCEIYWSFSPNYARKVVAKLRDRHRIKQPRLKGEEPESILNGCWRDA